MVLLVYCIVLLFDFVLSPALHNTFHTPVAWYSLFVLELPLNTNQPNQTVYLFSQLSFRWYLPSDWLERLLWVSLTSNHGEDIVSIKPRPKSVMVLLVYCIVLLFDFVLSPALLLWHNIACLCWRCHKAPINLTELFVFTVRLQLCAVSGDNLLTDLPHVRASWWQWSWTRCQTVAKSFKMKSAYLLTVYDNWTFRSAASRQRRMVRSLHR